MQYVIAYIGALVAFLVIDLIWIGVVAKGYYFKVLEPIIAQPMRLHIAAIFYAIYLVGVLYFAVRPALAEPELSGALKVAALNGALFGFFCYATYDLTNWATLQDWPTSISFIDIPWGTVLTATCAVAGTAAVKLILKDG